MSDPTDTLSDGPHAPKAGSFPEAPSQVVQDAAARDAAAPPAPGYAPKGQGDRLSSRTVSGGLWTIGTYVILNAIRFGANLILTRLLVPELFGTMALISALMAGIRLFSDVGIGPALITNPRGTEENFLRTAYTIQNIRGVFIWLVACMLAPWAASVFGGHDVHHEKLIYLMPVVGFAAVIEGLRSTAVFRIQRALHYGPLSIVELIEMFTVSVGMVLWARFISQDIWALVIPPLFSAFVGMSTTHLLLRDRRDRWGIDLDCAADMMRIGKWIFLSTLIMFFASQFEKLIFGRLVDARTMGLYNIALTVAAIPLTTVLKLGGSVLFPTFSRIAHDPDRFRSVYKRTRTMLLVAGAAIVCGMIACGPFAIRAMYRPEYEPSGWMLQLLAIGAWFQIVDASNVAALLAQQRPKLIAAGNLTKVAFMLALVPLAYHLPIDNQTPEFRLAMAFIALGIADAMRAIVSTAGVKSIGASSPRLTTPDFAFPFAIAIVGVSALFVARKLEAPLDSMLPPYTPKYHRFLLNGILASIAASIVIAVWLPICLVQWRRSRHGDGSRVRPARDEVPSFGADPAL